MPDTEETGTEKFCWVKAVMQAPPCEGQADACDGSSTWRLDCSSAPSMPPPPSPKCAADATGLPKLGRLYLLGGGTPPPSGGTIPRTPVSQSNITVATEGAGTAAGAEAEAVSDTGASDDYWQVASFAPGAELSASAPLVSLAFMPVRGEREQAMAWRLRNPGWFRDAVAVTLLNYAY